MVIYLYIRLFPGCLTRGSIDQRVNRDTMGITEDYDEIDRRDPPIFINNTRTRVVVAAGKTAALECRVLNIADRQVIPPRKADSKISLKDNPPPLDAFCLKNVPAPVFRRSSCLVFPVLAELIASQPQKLVQHLAILFQAERAHFREVALF